MKTGEKGILGFIVFFALAAMVYKGVSVTTTTEKDPGIPFYSTASKELDKKANLLIRKYNCRACHVLWAQRTIMQSVPAPSLDGLGSIRSEQWFFDYFSAENAQDILPSRLKAEFQMPSYAHLPEEERRALAAYMSSLKVEDWYLEDTKKREYEKLTGKEYKPE